MPNRNDDRATDAHAARTVPSEEASPRRKKPTLRNLGLILALWLFAFALCALVLWLMHLRGPAITP